MTETSRTTEPSDTSDTSGATLRADAERNRQRVLDAARELFAARGLDVPVAAVARRAGVGVATLYRRFPTRESLITEVFADQLGECVGVIDEALDAADPWDGFRLVLEKVCAMQTQDQGFTSAFLTAFPGAVDFERERVRAERGFAEVARRAKQAGALRADFDRTDLTLLMMANAGICADAPQTAQAASRRLVAYLLEAFRATPEPRAPLPPPAPVGLYQTRGVEGR